MLYRKREVVEVIGGVGSDQLFTSTVSSSENKNQVMSRYYLEEKKKPHNLIHSVMYF